MNVDGAFRMVPYVNRGRTTWPRAHRRRGGSFPVDTKRRIRPYCRVNGRGVVSTIPVITGKSLLQIADYPIWIVRYNIEHRCAF